MKQNSLNYCRIRNPIISILRRLVAIIISILLVSSLQSVSNTCFIVEALSNVNNIKTTTNNQQNIKNNNDQQTILNNRSTSSTTAAANVEHITPVEDLSSPLPPMPESMKKIQESYNNKINKRQNRYQSQQQQQQDHQHSQQNIDRIENVNTRQRKRRYQRRTTDNDLSDIPTLSDILDGKVQFSQDVTNRHQKTDEYYNKQSSQKNDLKSSQESGRDQTRMSSQIKPMTTPTTTTTAKAANTTVTTLRPWRANYKASKRTQGRIKKVFSTQPTFQNENNNKSTNLQSYHAQLILKELLHTPTQYCNAANLVCALTYSAKAMGQDTVHHENPDPILRQTLQQVLDIVYDLIVIHNDEKLFSARQLCNACWAIAKHVDRDPYLLPTKRKGRFLTTDMIILKDNDIQGWEWNSLPIDNVDINSVQKHNEDDQRNARHGSSEARLDETIDEIARQLTSILVDDQNDVIRGNSNATHNSRDNTDMTQRQSKSFQLPKIKIGEICMACWAYGKLRSREIPPGWPGPPQMGKVTTKSTNYNENSDIITTADGIPIIKFDQLGSTKRTLDSKNSDKSFVDENEELIPTSVTDRLFDAIAHGLCGKLSDKDTASLGSGTPLEQCTWSELANVGWAFASHGRCKSEQAESLLMKLSHEASTRLKEDGFVANNNSKNLLVRDISQLIWSLGTLQADNFRLADGVIDLVEALTSNLRLGTKTGSTFTQGRPLRRWSCADLVQVAISLGHARIDEQRLLRAIYEESIFRLLEGSAASGAFSTSVAADTHLNRQYGESRRSFHPWEASILLWVQARLYLTEQQGIEFAEYTESTPKFFLKALQQNRGSFSKSRIDPQVQANIVWSLVVLEQYKSPEAKELIKLIFREAARSCKEDKSIQLEHAHQLWQAYFILNHDCPDAVDNVPDWFVTYLREKWSLEKARDKLSSARHRSLSSTLQLMGVDHVNEHDEDIDVAIILQPNAMWVHETDSMDEGSSDSEDGKVLLAVEFDGPNHFTRINPASSEQPRALGHTVLKYRLLKRQGWTVVRVPYYEFDKIPFWASMERQRYLQRKLKTHANIQFSQIDVSEYKELVPNRKSRFD